MEIILEELVKRVVIKDGIVTITRFTEDSISFDISNIKNKELLEESLKNIIDIIDNI